MKPVWRVIGPLNHADNWRWGFGVLGSLLPFFLEAFRLSLQGLPWSIADVIGGGELLIVSVGITAAASVSLFGRKNDQERTTIIAGGGLVSMSLLSAALYTQIQAMEEVDEVYVVRVSVAFFFWGLVVALATRSFVEAPKGES